MEKEKNDYESKTQNDKLESVSECEIVPEDYNDPVAYLDVLAEAKYDWRLYCEDGSEFWLDPFDYETEDEYSADLINEEYRRYLISKYGS